MTTPIRVLIVEDVSDDAELLLFELRRGGYAPTWERVETPEEMRTALERHAWDIILSDYTLPQFSAQAALTLAIEVAPDVPFVVVSGTIGEEVAVETMRAGASDYVLKRSLTRLGPAVQRELREAANRRERRRAEQAAYRLAAIVQSSDDAVIGKTLDGIITDWNPGAERLYGYAAAEVVGKHIGVLVPPDREEELAGIMARLKRGERISSLETVRLRKDGSPVHVSLTISPILDTAGRVIGASKTARDITEKRQADEALRRQTRLLESVLTSMGDGVIGADEQGNYLIFNPAAAAIVGVGKLNCLPHEWAKQYGLYLSDGVTLYPTHQLPVLRAIRGEAVDDLEMLIRNETVPEGRWISVTTRPLVDGIAGKRGGVAVFRDITERKKAEEQSARFAAIVRDSNDAIISKTLDGMISSWNPGAERLYGYTADEVIGKSMRLLIPPHHEEELKEIMGRIGRGERVESYETVRLHKGGSPVHVFVTISPIQNTAGQIIGISSIARDITERKLAEQEVAESHRRFEQTLDAVSDLFVAFDRQWNYTYLNRKAAAFTGHEPGDLVGKNMWDLFPAAVGSGFHNELLAAASSETVRQFEAFYPQTERWYEHRAYPHREGLSLFSSDVTERKRQELAVRERIRLAAFGRDAGLAIAHAGTMAEMLDLCTTAMVEHLDAGLARVWTISETGDVLQLQASSGMYTHLDGPHSRIPVGQFKIGLIASTREPHLSNAVPDDPQVSDPEWARREGMVAFAGYPLVVEGRLVGVMALFARRPLSDVTMEAMGSVANAVALGIERWRATDALRASEERLRRDAMLLANVRDSVIVADPAGIVTYWNDGATRLFGWSAEEMVGRPLANRFPEAVRGDFAEKIRTQISNEWFGELEDWRKDGSRVWINARVSRITDAAGNVIGAIGLSYDITDRKRAEADLRASEERLRLAAEAARFGTFDHDFITGQTFRSVEFKLIFGLPVDAPFEVAADGLPVYIHCEDREAVREQTKAVLDPANSGVGEMQHRIVRADDGAIRWVLVRGRTTFSGEGKARRPTRFTGILLDLTDRLQAEEALHLRDRAIQAVVSGILITDSCQPNNPIIYASPGFERLTGYRQEEVLGKNCRLLQGKDTDRQAVAEIRAAVREGRSCESELVNYRKDGTSFWNRLLISPVRDGAGRLTHFVGVQTDVTERRSLEEQFRQAQKMEAVGRLAGGVAHDFNNLLTIINGYGDIVARSLPADHPAKELVLQIAKAGERAASLTQQLLAFSRKTVLEPKVLDLNIQIREMVKLLRRTIGEDIQLVTSFDPGLGRVKADPGQLEQAIINLCVNARDAMPQGGKITIETRNVEFDEFHAQGSVDLLPGNYVLLAVMDTGQGMDAATQARIFEPFFTTKEPGKGTGLGLAMVYGFIKQSMGHIAVQSVPGHGTTFKLYLPRIEQAISSGMSHPNLNFMPRGDETLLLVEDEPAVRALGRHVLQSCGYTVLEGGDGNEALRVARRHSGPLHLLLTDVVMPNLGGRQVAEQVLVLHPEAKVLFLSGYTDDAVVRHGVQEAHTNFLQKPFTPSCLAQKVREILDQRTALDGL